MLMFGLFFLYKFWQGNSDNIYLLLQWWYVKDIQEIQKKYKVEK